ncbi:uncharacterized protein LOC129609214 [Condylostylus longicornis]|uniref:uncharacterized protein LOC129609214 n=1 Tax=Condylostylus longicornis TaxID=2530218 RepID=UPI00244E1ABF|nr:uncharacterized protein LOC129609214 [Condylostylus longicornis]
MSIKDSPSKKIGFLLTEVAMGLLDHKYFDLDGRPVNDLQCLVKYNRNEEDYSKDDKDLLSLLKITKSSLAENVSCNIADTIDLDDAEDSVDNNSDKLKSKDGLPNEVEKIQTPEESTASNTNVKNTLSEKSKNVPLENSELVTNKYEEKLTDTDSEIGESVAPPNLNVSLIKSDLRPDRVKYLIDLTQSEFLKTEKAAKIRRRKFLRRQRLGKTDKTLLDFYKEEKKLFEMESEALISFIKVVKKTEFPPDNSKLIKLVTKISGDIMEAKKAIEWKTML